MERNPDLNADVRGRQERVDSARSLPRLPATTYLHLLTRFTCPGRCHYIL
jgi:hypothetical protein